MRKEIARFRFYIGRALMQAGLFIMPFEAAASVWYNTLFLDGRDETPRDA